jgi:hypothetical protein
VKWHRKYGRKVYFSSIFFISVHYSTCLTSLLYISFHISTCLFSIFSILFHNFLSYFPYHEMIWKIWKKAKLNNEKIWKIGRKSKLNNEKIWKLWRFSHFNLPFFHIFDIISQFSSIFSISFHNFLPYYPYHFTIQPIERQVEIGEDMGNMEESKVEQWKNMENMNEM